LRVREINVVCKHGSRLWGLVCEPMQFGGVHPRNVSMWGYMLQSKVFAVQERAFARV